MGENGIMKRMDGDIREMNGYVCMSVNLFLVHNFY